MLTILPYLLSVYGRSKCTLSTCPVFGEYFNCPHFNYSIGNKSLSGEQTLLKTSEEGIIMNIQPIIAIRLMD
jgi:hypothetical protein